jgi:hypothetical protein
MNQKMAIRQRLEAFWMGESPALIPYTIYQNEWRHTQEDPAWLPMFHKGLGLTWPVPSYRVIHKGVEYVESTRKVDGKVFLRQAYQTPFGEVSAEWLDDWPVKYWLETEQDYRLMQHVVEHTQVEPDYAYFQEFEAQQPEYVIVHPSVGPSPILKIINDFAGLEKFAYHLADYSEAMVSLFEALRLQFRRTCEIVAGGPGKFVWVPESYSAEMLSRKHFNQFLLPVYTECFPVLRAAGKIVGAHFDGKTAAYKDAIRALPIDLIESLTPPPEGDQTLEEACRAWPDKLFWCNINVSCYDLPRQALKETIRTYALQAASDGRGVAFEVSEQYPANWKESMPLVLEALEELQAGSR